MVKCGLPVLLLLCAHTVGGFPSIPTPVHTPRYCTSASECGSGADVRCAGGVCGCVATCFTYFENNSSCVLQRCFEYTNNVCSQPGVKDRTVAIVLAVFLGMFGAPAWYVGDTLIGGVVLGVTLGMPVLFCVFAMAAKDAKAASSCISCVYGMWVFASWVWMIVFASVPQVGPTNCPLFA